MMDASSRKSRILAVILVGAVYFVVGFVFAALANPIASAQTRSMWRLVPWVVSAAIFAAHIGYEKLRLGNSTGAMALHAAMAVAFGALLLAVNATIHATTVESHAPYWRYTLALVLWPIFTAVPAFMVALIAAAVLARLTKKRERR